MKMPRLRRALTLITMVCIAVPGAAADLSPARWPEAERLLLEQREAAIWPTEIRDARSGQGLVTGTASPIAVHAGAEALRQGGTAADAAIATALTQVTTMLGANVSYAGVAQTLGMSEGAVKVAVHRLRDRYRALIRAEIAQTVADPAEVDDELRQLFAALGR